MANEKRLIDANALRTQFDDIPPYIGLAGSLVQQYIDKAPTVDAVEVVHGYVIPTDEPKHILMDRQCGICNNLMLATDNYCPMCGAKNEGERVE